MFDRVSARIRSVFERFSVGPIAGEPVEAWRFEPGDWDDLWARAAVIHFPDDKPGPRFFAARNIAEPAFARTAAATGTTGEFQGFRPYEPGDDPREVDWRATSHARQAMVRQRSREGRRPVAIVVDVSASMWVESKQASGAVRPIDMAFETAVWLAAAATLRQSPLDVIFTTDRIELHLPRLQGRHAIRQVVSAATGFRPDRTATGWSHAVQDACRFRSGSYVFWISDFTWLPDPLSFRRAFASVQSSGVRIVADPASVIAFGGLVRDAETGEVIEAERCMQGRSFAERVDRWSVESAVPVLDVDVLVKRPELLLADWLRGSDPARGRSR